MKLSNKILLGSLVFVGLYNILFYPTVLGIGLGLLFLLFHLYLYSVRSQILKSLQLAFLMSILSVVFALLVGIAANGIVQGFDLLIAVFLSFTAGYFYKKETIFPYSILSFFLIPLLAFGESLASLSNFFTIHKHQKTSGDRADIYNGIFRGVIIAIPIIFILYLLLVGADPIFRALAGNISFSVSWQIILSIIIFAICFVWGIMVIKGKLEDRAEESIARSSEEKLVFASLVVAVGAATLFAVFLIVQLRYLFLQVPETELHRLGINVQTYSEYVRQGFFQLLVASSISGSIVAFILRYLHRLTIKHKLYLRIGMILLTLETELLLLSAGKRLYLYEQLHGLTRPRFLGMIFLFWLGFFLIVLYVAILKKLKAKHFFATVAISALIVFTSINIVSMDFLIATRFQPTINHEVDYTYIMNLSPEAASVWPSFVISTRKQLLALSSQKHSDDDLRIIFDAQTALLKLNRTIYYLERKYSSDAGNLIQVYDDTLLPNNNYLGEQKKWQAFNLSEYNAYLLIRANRSLFGEVKPLIEDTFQKQKDWSSQK